VENSSFLWVSPRRVRGSKSFKHCTCCGCRLFQSDSDSLDFVGTHPIEVLCLSCMEAQRARSVGWHPDISLAAITSLLRAVDSVRPTSVGVSALASLVVAGILASSLAIRTADTAPRLGGFEDIQDVALVYVPPGQGLITQHYLEPYVSYLDEDGSRTEWLFDSFLFLTIYTDSMSTFWGPSSAADWRGWMDKLFRPGQQIDALDREVEEAKRHLGKTSKRGVIISIPYPSPETPSFGLVEGSRLDFSREGRKEESTQDRLRACTWFVDEVVSRWIGQGYDNLELVGFYWFQEELMEGDVELVNRLSDYLRQEGYGLYWIPFNSEKNLDAVRAWQRGEIGFEYVWIQPNYAFKYRENERWRELRDLDTVARIAGELNASLEIEVDENSFLAGDVAALNNFYNYLDTGLTYLYVHRPLAYYIFPYDMYSSANSLVRQSYDALCRFVKGRHNPVSYFLHRDIGSHGPAVNHPSIHLETPKDWGPKEVLDGIAAYLAAPGARIRVDDMDPHKDAILAIKYLTFLPTSVELSYGSEEGSLGKLVADGYWHTTHWKIDLSSRARKSFEVAFTNLTWVSAVWVYPEETILRLDVGQAWDAPGIFTEVPPAGGVWDFRSGDEAVFRESDPQKLWMAGITYRSSDSVEITLANGRDFQTVTLEESGDWAERVFHVNPHDGSSSISFVFRGRIEVSDLWVAPSPLHTNVGTDWDTNPIRHTPGVSVAEGWSASRLDQMDGFRTFRAGGDGSTLFVSDLEGYSGVIVTLEYRSSRGVSVKPGRGKLELAFLPTAPEWTTMGFLVPGGATEGVLELSGQIDLASAWLEAAR
jgi:hypothetical protein